jgi:predicted RNA-binding protein with PIN domain
MPRDLVIDGYNLLHAAGLARRHYGPGDLERARRELLRLIAGQMSDEQRRRTTFVFDAKDPPPDSTGQGTHAEMLVLYAQEDEEADDLIERIILAHSSPRQLVVVSSDHRLHKSAKRRKATPLDSDAFLDECARRVYSRRMPRPEPELKPECDTSPGAIEEWLAVFDIDPHEIDVEPSSPAAKVEPVGKSKPVSRRLHEPKGKPRRGAKKRRSSPPVIEDVAFWEARIAELFRRSPEEFGDEG